MYFSAATHGGHHGQEEAPAVLPQKHQEDEEGHQEGQKEVTNREDLDAAHLRQEKSSKRSEDALDQLDRGDKVERQQERDRDDQRERDEQPPPASPESA